VHPAAQPRDDVIGSASDGLRPIDLCRPLAGQIAAKTISLCAFPPLTIFADPKKLSRSTNNILKRRDRSSFDPRLRLARRRGVRSSALPAQFTVTFDWSKI
jgi:hypothetical protein